MSNLLTSVTSGNTTILDNLVNAYVQTQQPKLDALATKKSTLEANQSYFSSLNGKLNTLITQLDKMKATDANSQFGLKSVSSTEPTFVTATADGNAVVADFNIKVYRKAANDILVSKKLTLASTFDQPAGEQTFDIKINGVAKQVKVTLVVPETNESAMKKIAASINGTTDVGVVAAFVKDSGSTGRLSITSKKTGGMNNIEFTDSGVLNAIGLDSSSLGSGTTSRTLGNDTDAGYKTADFNTLDSKFEVNGINVTRDSNTVTDVLDGVTLNLLKTQKVDDESIVLSTQVDTTKVKAFIQPFLDTYNGILKFANSNSALKRQDSSISNLASSLRNQVTTDLSNGDSNAFKYLADIGIKSSSTGELSISNETIFTDALKADFSKVAALFTGTNGLSDKINNSINPLKGDDGVLKSRANSYTNQIDDNMKKTALLQGRIDAQAAALRKQYTSYLDTLYKAQGQYSYLNTASSSTTTNTTG